jgi:NAD(P)-dependent dehydrogenase (short-subunit alcohol dehydrogenase family)
MTQTETPSAPSEAWPGTTVVTGAGSGIGRALVLELAARGARSVVVADLDGSAAEATVDLVAAGAGARFTAAQLDVADPEAVEGFVMRTHSETEPILGWFSNAGVHRGQGLGSPDDWRLSLDVNLMAHVVAARAILPAMEARRQGRFVITASAAGLLSDLRSAPYSASKHAAVGLAEWLAIGAAEGVYVGCVCPEGVTTAMTRPDSRHAAKSQGSLQPEAVARTVLDAAERGDFLILTHPRTGEFEQRRTADRERWLKAMRRARSEMDLGAGLFPAA